MTELDLLKSGRYGSVHKESGHEQGKYAVTQATEIGRNAGMTGGSISQQGIK